MIYDTPSVSIFQNRKQFHTSQKSPTETTTNWFKRLQCLIESCKFNQLSDYMLIDKFMSGLSESDFETISQVPMWTIDELILVVIGTSHIFDTKQPIDNRQPRDDKSLVKPEQIIEETINGENSNRVDSLLNESSFGKRRLTATERKQNFIARLKMEGKYDEYKRKSAATQMQRRLQAKTAEQLLAPELQIHLITQRRKAKRDKATQNCNQQKSKRISKKTERTDANEEWLEQVDESTHRFKIEPEINLEQLSSVDPDLEFAPADILETTLTATSPIRKREYNVARPRKKRSFECYLCPTQCETLRLLKEHLKIFHAARPLVLKCHLCDKTTKSRELLTRHLRKFHLEIPMHKCPCCMEKFSKARDMNQHVKEMHPEYKPFVCEVCGFSTKANFDLYAHMRVHTGRKDSKCDICGQLFSTTSARNKHMAIHTGVKNYHCQHCDTHFSHPSTLRRHLMCIHGLGEKPAVCEYCGKRFNSRWHLKLHTVTHTGDRPYKCDLCGSTFTQPASLRHHTNRMHQKSLNTNHLSTFHMNVQ